MMMAMAMPNTSVWTRMKAVRLTHHPLLEHVRNVTHAD